MSFTDTVVLGALAGFTIFLGLPFARLDLLGTRSRIALAMFAVTGLSLIPGIRAVGRVDIARVVRERGLRNGRLIVAAVVDEE